MKPVKHCVAWCCSLCFTAAMHVCCTAASAARAGGRQENIKPLPSLYMLWDCQSMSSSLRMNPSAGRSLYFSVEVMRRSRAGGHWLLGVLQSCTVRGSPVSLRQPLPSDLVQKSSLQIKRLCCFTRLESQPRITMHV